MNELYTTALNGTVKVRAININGEPWFVAADVCRTLGYNEKSNGSVNTHHALNSLDANEINTHRIPGTRGRPSKVISESALYRLIMRSDKPEAKVFQDWVCRVVLPSIRKDGGYFMGEEKVLTREMSDDEFMAHAAVFINAKLEGLAAARLNSQPSFQTPELISLPSTPMSLSNVDDVNTHGGC